MNDKKKYLEQSEIKVKSLIADLYIKESETKKEMLKVRDKLTQKIDDLELHYNNAAENRKLLKSKYELLQQANERQWETAKTEFELLLDEIEGDREGFIKKAESIINEIGNKIKDAERKTVVASSEVRADLGDRVNELKKTRAGLQEKLEELKSDTSDKWFKVRNWFIEKTENIKDIITREHVK